MGRIYLVILLLVLADAALARQANYARLTGHANYNFGTWSAGDGNQSYTMMACAASSNYRDAFPDPPPTRNPPALQLNYDYKLSANSAVAGHYLFLNGDDSLTGNTRIPVQFYHQDIKVGTDNELLADDTWDLHNHTGQFRNCGNGDNSALEIVLLQDDMEMVQAGNYRAQFTASLQGGTSGTNLSTERFRVSISVSQVVQVTGLQDMDLGSWSGSGDIAVDETFCVYSNNTTAGYNISISSTYQDAGGNFRLMNTDQSAMVPYQLSFLDAVAGTGTAVSTAALSGQGSNTSSNCAGADNAKLSILVTAADMQAVPGDAYSDTITLVVAPL